MAAIPEIDRLIEEGLSLYGQGDLDRALLAWEQVLAIDPGNEQASSYVDYVRANYELLTSEARRADDAPFAIGADEPDYEIEIAPGEVTAGVPTPGPMHIDPLDEGWSLGEDEIVAPEGTLTIAKARISEQMTIANPDAADFGAAPDDAPFADPRTLSQTLRDADVPEARPFHHRDSIAARLADFDEPKTTEAVAPSRTTSGDQVTLELEADEPPGQAAPSPPAGGGEVSFEAPTREYDASSRILAEFRPEETPPFGLPMDTQSGGHVEFDSVTSIQERYRGFVKPTAPPALKMSLRTPEAVGPPPVSLPDEDSEATLDRILPGSADDLLSGLPSPTAAEPLQSNRSTMRTPGPSRPPANVPVRGPTTREYPAAPRPPAPTAPPESVSTSAPTRDFPLEEATSLPPRIFDSPLISAPTRDLGLRAAALAEVESTKLAAPTPPKPDDPDAARTVEILSTIDDNAPPDEPKDDRTRRRIMTLFERAASWSRAGDLEHAVTAVDLAMSEDPNSALAQKLIHRNRDTIMFVFQGYLGDMNRTPVLARPLHQLGDTTINPRAAFLLSRIDGLLTLEEILDVSGMPRLEAFRYLCQLFLRGILR